MSLHQNIILCLDWSNQHLEVDIEENPKQIQRCKMAPYEGCAQVQSELRKYISEHGVFGNLYATKDQDGLSYRMVEHAWLRYHISV